MMFRPVRAVAAPTLERAIDGILSSHVPEAVARSLVEHRVVERVAAEVLRETDVEAELSTVLESERFEQLLRQALTSPALERLLRQVMTSPALERSLHSPEFQHLLEQILASPQVRQALTQQSTSFATEAAAHIRGSTAHADDAIEGRVHRWLHLAPRIATVRFGGLATRGTALVVDAIILTLVSLVGAAAVALVTSFVGHLRPVWLADALGAAAWVLLLLVYFVGFWSAAGQTPGMRLMHLRAVRGTGARLGVGRSFVRAIGLALAIIPCLAGFLPALVDSRRRALPDYLAGTVVVYDDPSSELGDAASPPTT
jgi:uncharacterized RDD family membrane protein YckC